MSNSTALLNKVVIVRIKNEVCCQEAIIACHHFSIAIRPNLVRIIIIWPLLYSIISILENAVLNKVGLKGPSEKAILSAMKEWEKKTCIQFKPRTNEKDYIEFIDDGFGKYVTFKH